MYKINVVSNESNLVKKINYFVFVLLRLASLTNFTGSARIVKRRFL